MKSLIVLLSMLAISLSAQDYPIIKSDAWVKLTEGLAFPEGPSTILGTTYFSNCHGGWVGAYSEKGLDTLVSKNTHPDLIKNTNGTIALIGGDLLVCEYGYGKILQVSTAGDVKEIAPLQTGYKLNRPNDLAQFTHEVFYFSDPKSYDKNIKDGRVFWVNLRTGELKVVAENLAFPNGIVFSHNRKTLYLCESAEQVILKFDVDAYGELTNRQVFLELPGGDPDGLMLDDDGNIYVAHFGGSAVWVVSPEGKIIKKIETPGSKPSNLEFIGEYFEEIVITETETNALYKLRIKN